MIDTIFALCVHALVWLAGLLGLTYEEINVYLFVVLWPLVTLLLIGVVIGQQLKLRRLQNARR